MIKRKNLLIGILSFMLALSVIMFTMPKGVKASENIDRTFKLSYQELNGKDIVFFGDSLTARYGLETSDKDYMQLWHLGTYDTETAEIDTCIPELIMKGVDIYG